MMIVFKGCNKFASQTDLIEIESGNDVWDLHNACEFIEFLYNVLDRKLTFIWNCYDYNSGTISNKIYIQLSEVNWMEISPRDSDMPYDEDTCLEHINYYPDINKILFLFRGGLTIDVKCAELKFATFPFKD